MADKPIIKIDVDSAAFDEFQKRFEEFKSDMGDLPEEWADTNAEIEQMESSFEKAAAAFNRLASSAGSNKLDQAFTKTTKNSKETGLAWSKITKDIEKASKHMSGLARLSLNLGAFGMLGAMAAIPLEMYHTTFDGAQSMADINKNARALGLKPGEEQAFNDVYGRAGGDSALLGKMAGAKSDRSQWAPLLAAGISQKDIETKDATALSAEFLEKAGAAFKAHDQNHMGGAWADAVGLSKFADVNSLRLAGSYGHGDYVGMRDQYNSAVPKLAQDQKSADAATQFVSDMKLVGDELKNNFYEALVPLEPVFKELATEVGNAFTAYAKSGKLKEDIEEVAHGFEDLLVGLHNMLKFFHFVDSVNNDPKNNPDAAARDSVHQFGVKVWDGAKQSWHDMTEAMGFGNQTGDKGDFKPVANRNAYFGALEKQQGLPQGMLDTIEDIESSRGQHNTGPLTKYGRAKGSFQLLDGTAKQYGVGDQYDEKQAAAGAALYLRDLEKRYHGNVGKAIAAYNWGQGNLDKDLKEHGDKWQDFLPEQTKGYLKKAAAHGLDLNGQAPGANPTVQARPDRQQQFENARIVTEQEERREGGHPPPMQPQQTSILSQVMGGLSRSIDELNKTMQGLRTPDQSQRSKLVQHQGGPFSINVKVSTPPGSNAAVTYGSLPQ